MPISLTPDDPFREVAVTFDPVTPEMSNATLSGEATIQHGSLFGLARQLEYRALRVGNAEPVLLRSNDVPKFFVRVVMANDVDYAEIAYAEDDASFDFTLDEVGQAPADVTLKVLSTAIGHADEDLDDSSDAAIRTKLHQATMLAATQNLLGLLIDAIAGPVFDDFGLCDEGECCEDLVEGVGPAFTGLVNGLVVKEDPLDELLRDAAQSILVSALYEEDGDFGWLASCAGALVPDPESGPRS